MKLGQLIEYTKANVFYKNHAQHEAGRLVPDLFFFFKSFIKVKESGQQFSFDTL